jgi:AAA+ ATPase superfamily predicted ATPase
MDQFDFRVRDDFVNRAADLARLEEWWADKTRDALGIYGRRRVGKSWLFRRFAHGKPAVILVADERAVAPQLARFADHIGARLDGVRPSISDAADLVRVLYRLGRRQRIVAVIDEFPLLLPKGSARQRMLSAVGAVMEEERDDSKTKLILCGSIIGQMESLLAQRSPLHGRLQPLDVRPMTFGESRQLLQREQPADMVTRYSVTGGMARYLAEIGSRGSLRQRVCERVLDRQAPLFDDPRLVLERELRAPAIYFSLLEELARGEAGIDHLAEALGSQSPKLTGYLDTLREMRLVSAHRPAGAAASSRKRKYRLDDGFIRFWFRFVFPHQEDLDSGLAATDLWDGVISAELAGHTAQTFEELCRVYTRRRYGMEAPSVAGWWGEADPRYKPERREEEIDIVGLKRKRAVIVGECKWTTGRMPRAVLDDLETYKIPALLRDKAIKPSTEGPRILLFGRSGFSADLEGAASDAENVELITVDKLVTELLSSDSVLD